MMIKLSLMKASSTQLIIALIMIDSYVTQFSQNDGSTYMMKNKI